jgi:hypothetical protein
MSIKTSVLGFHGVGSNFGLVLMCSDIFFVIESSERERSLLDFDWVGVRQVHMAKGHVLHLCIVLCST